MNAKFAIAVCSALLALSLQVDIFVAFAQEKTNTEDAKQAIRAAAETKRKEFEKLSFEEFKTRVYKEPFDGGKFIVNGDTPIANEKLLREFYERNVKNKPKTFESEEAAVFSVGGLDAVWSNSQKRALTYCVSKSFGNRYSRVVSDMRTAADALQSVGDISFIHVASEDESCTPANVTVAFDVRPVQVSGEYLARAFFPNEPRALRNLLIDESSFQLDPNNKLKLVGILRHELGHVIGLRHEHTRPESGSCFEDTDFRPLTNYDAFSFMHYPQCNGKGDWSLQLTDSDKNGIACLYGPAPGFIVNAKLCLSSKIRTVVFDGEFVKQGEQKRAHGPFNVAAGTTFRVAIKGLGSSPGDPDLYLKFDATAQLLEYDCRPFVDGADEECSVDVPPGKSIATIMVHGHREAHYAITVTYTEP